MLGAALPLKFVVFCVVFFFLKIKLSDFTSLAPMLRM